MWILSGARAWLLWGPPQARARPLSVAQRVLNGMVGAVRRWELEEPKESALGVFTDAVQCVWGRHWGRIRECLLWGHT